jgi:hypothetical protein
MARHVIKRGLPSPRDTELVEVLSDELASGKRVQPAFIEEEFNATGLRNIHVIWDRWADIPYDDRMEVILRAYEKHEGPEKTENVAIAEGLTGPEALEAGLLPFIVSEGSIDRDFLAYENAKSVEMEQTILGKRELRYPTKEAAEEAVARLRESLPGSQWQIVSAANQSYL